jgi:hypothetical protein
MELMDYMASTSNIKAAHGGSTSYGGYLLKLLSLSWAVRGSDEWNIVDQIYDDGQKIHNPQQRAEWRMENFKEWEKGRVVKVGCMGDIAVTVHLILMWGQKDGPATDETEGTMCFKNPNW